MTFIKESVQAAYGICRKNCPFIMCGGKHLRICRLIAVYTGTQIAISCILFINNHFVFESERMCGDN